MDNPPNLAADGEIRPRQNLRGTVNLINFPLGRILSVTLGPLLARGPFLKGRAR